MERYARVALGGAPERFEIFVESLRQWFSVSVFSPKREQFVAIFDVVTEQKAREEKLTKAQERLALAQRAAHAGAWDWDVASGTLVWSEEFFLLFGLDPKCVTPSFETWHRCVHPDDLKSAESTIADAIRNHAPLTNEYRVILPSGEIRQILAYGDTTYDEQGQPVRMTGLCIDATESKRAGLALLESRAQLEAALSSMTDAVFISDAAGNFIHFNEAFATFHKFGNVEECKKTLAEYPVFLDVFMADGTLAPLDQWAVPRALRGEVGVGVEYGLRRKDTGEAWTGSYNFAPIRNADGAIVGTVVTGRDITASKQAEVELEKYRYHLEELVEQRSAELAKTEAHASLILRSSADGLYGIDTDCRITFINPAACQMLGYSQEQVIGQRAHSLFHHSKPDGSPYPVEECPSHGSLLHGLEARNDNEVYWHADGHSIPVMYAIHPMAQEDGRIDGAVISFVDMSEQRTFAQAREQALLAAEHLARVRSEFLANMSHEIRTPINGVLGFAEIGARNYQNSEKAKNAFDKILISGKRLLGVINEILDFSKIEAGKLTIEQIETSLKEVAEHAVELVREQARAKHLDLWVELAPDLPQLCLSDPLHLGQVLLNLLSNAIKFTESGSVTLSASRSANQLVFTIEDTGIGMNEAQLKHLFNPFEQGDGSLTRKYGGTGLGLAISKRILDLMGGDIRVESRPGAGSTFTFRIAFVEAPARVQAPPSPPVDRTVAARPLAGLSILVVDDEVINQMVLQVNLTEDGARMAMASNGREAVELVKQVGPNGFDIVLMDVQMPEMDGYEATRRILEHAPGLPILGQTAHALTEERDKCLAAGMVGHIAKPIDHEALVELIRRHVVLSRAPMESLGLRANGAK